MMKSISLVALAILLALVGCADPKARQAADAELETSSHQLNTLKNEIKALPLLMSQVEEAQQRVDGLVKERDALKKAVHR